MMIRKVSACCAVRFISLISSSISDAANDWCKGVSYNVANKYAFIITTIKETLHWIKQVGVATIEFGAMRAFCNLTDQIDRP